MTDLEFIANRRRWISQEFSPLEDRRALIESRILRLSYGSIAFTLTLAGTLFAFGLVESVIWLVAIWALALVAFRLTDTVFRKLQRSRQTAGLSPTSVDLDLAIPLALFVAVAGVVAVAATFLAAGQPLASGCVVTTALLCVAFLFGTERT